MNWLKVSVCILATAFFDLYWLYSVLVAGALCIVMLRKDIWSRFRRFGTLFKLSITLGFISAGWAIFRALVTVSGSRDETNLSRPISITKLETIKTQAANLIDYVDRPWGSLLGGERNIHLPVGYVGLPVTILAICGIVLTLKKKKTKLIALISILYVLLTLQPEFEMFGRTFPLPSGFFRYISPGLLYPTRFGIIAVVLITVMAATGVSEIFNRLKISRSVKVAVLSLTFVIVAIDLNPFADRVFSNEYDRYSVARTELQRDPNALVLALPLTKFIRTWHEQWFLGVPFANSMYNAEIGMKIDKQLSGGPGSFAAFLNRSGIDYLYTYDSGSLEMLGFRVDEPRFKKIASISTYGYEQGRVQMSLYKVTALPDDMPCVSCIPIKKNKISGTYASDDGGKSYWASAESAYINVSNSGPLNVWREPLVSTVVTFDVYSLNKQIIEISDLGGKIVVNLEPNRGFRYTAAASSVNPVRITAKLPCAKPILVIPKSTDTRSLCFNIFDFNK